MARRSSAAEPSTDGLDPDTLHSGERLDVPADGKPASHDAEDHAARYEWAAGHVRGRILDVACGTGHGSVVLARRGQLTAIDYHRGALAVARARVPSACFFCAELPAIPLADDAFDCVVSFETIEHIPDDKRFVSELRRVLAPGGTLLLSTPNGSRSEIGGELVSPWHVREYKLPELRGLLEEASFRVVDVLGQRRAARRLLERQVLRVVARFPILCGPRRPWDLIAHGTPRVRPYAESDIPHTWVLRCQ